jgi:hypothetical protein
MAGLGTLAHGETRGLQLAGVGAGASGSFTGAQFAGVVTAADYVQGLQMAGAVALADDVRGLQLAPLNIARAQAGMQLGVVNAADDGGGLRFGVVNVARKTRGFQFGVVNVAREDDGESFALLNLIGNGIHNVAFYATDAMLTNLALKLGGRHLYTSLGAGYRPGDKVSSTTMTLSTGTERWSSNVGIGWRLGVPAGRLEALEIEASTSQVYSAWSVTGTPALLNALRVTGVVRLVPGLSLIAGVGCNVVVGHDGRDLDLSLGGPQDVIRDGRTTVRIYPGFLAGLQI